MTFAFPIIQGGVSVSAADEALAYTVAAEFRSTSNNDVYTASARAIGPTGTNRRVCIAVAYNFSSGQATLGAITIGGVTATVHEHIGAGGDIDGGIFIASALVPTGSTADVVVNTNDDLNTIIINTTTVTGLPASPTIDTFSDEQESGGDYTLPLDTAAKCFVIGIASSETNIEDTFSTEFNASTFTNIAGPSAFEGGSHDIDYQVGYWDNDGTWSDPDTFGWGYTGSGGTGAPDRLRCGASFY